MAAAPIVTTGPKVRLSSAQWNLILLMVAVSAVSYFDRTILSIASPGIIKEFGISETEMGTIFSAYLMTYTILMAPAGAVVDRFGPRLVLGVAGLGAGLFTALTALCGSPLFAAVIGVVPSFLLVRFAFGISTAPIYTACGRLTATWVPGTYRARVQGLVMAASALGSATSPVLFIWMIARYGWRRSFVIAGACTMALYVLWCWYVRDRPSGAAAVEDAPRANLRQWSALLRNRNLALLTVSYVCLNYFEYIFFYWIYYYFGEIRHMGATESAVYVTILMSSMVVMTPVGGWISDRLVARYGRRMGRRIVPVAACCLSALLLAAGASGLSTFLTVTLLSLAFGCAASAEGPFWASAIDAGRDAVGVSCGIMNTGGNFGGMLAPIVTPIIARHFGWTWGLYVASAVVLSGVAAWFFIDMERE